MKFGDVGLTVCCFVIGFGYQSHSVIVDKNYVDVGMILGIVSSCLFSLFLF
jgi:hypothetical protein